MSLINAGKYYVEDEKNEESKVSSKKDSLEVLEQ